VPERALAGIAHGAAGIAWALTKLWTVTGLDKLKDAAIGGIEYERSLFSAAEGNWLDLRRDAAEHATNGGKSKFMASWCHGAPGIGMARIATLQNLPLTGTQEEIEVALRTTRACSCTPATGLTPTAGGATSSPYQPTWQLVFPATDSAASLCGSRRRA
jgi:lantibiotic modifying enzyme